MENQYPIYAAQGGGKVRHLGEGVYVFTEVPENFSYAVDDTMPKDWGVVPFNEAAKHETYQLDGFFDDWEDLMFPSQYP